MRGAGGEERREEIWPPVFSLPLFITDLHEYYPSITGRTFKVKRDVGGRTSLEFSNV